MRRNLALSLALSLAAQPLRGSAPSNPELEAGIQQVREGNFETALLTLDAVVRKLQGQAGDDPELAQAHLHLGVAYVGLMQETPAREHFKRALKHDSHLTLDPMEFPPRVIRVFEAARTNKTKPVLLATGGVGAGAAVAALLLAGGAASVAAAAPIPTPAPPVQPTTSTGPGRITFVSATPGVGSTLAGCANGAICSLAMAFTFVADSSQTDVAFTTQLMTSAGNVCLDGTNSAVYPTVTAGQTYQAGHESFRNRCTPPFTTSTMRAAVVRGSTVVFSQDYAGATYTVQ